MILGIFKVRDIKERSRERHRVFRAIRDFERERKIMANDGIIKGCTEIQDKAEQSRAGKIRTGHFPEQSSCISEIQSTYFIK